MKIHITWAVFGSLAVSTSALAPAQQHCRYSRCRTNFQFAHATNVADETEAKTPSKEIESLTTDIISKLHYREAQRELERRALDSSGTLTAMRSRLREVTNPQRELSVPDDTLVIDAEVINEAFAKRGIDFQDTSDPDFDFKALIRETLDKADRGHWKAATRRLKRLDRRFGQASSDPRSIPEEVYAKTLAACVADRLHGARAAEPARRIMEVMAENGCELSSETVNYCIKNSLGAGPNGRHDGHGGIDCALAMLAAVEVAEQPTSINIDTYQSIIATMAREGAIEDAMKMLRLVVIEKSETPPLDLFADVATACVKSGAKQAENVMNVLNYAKVSGYELDNIASTAAGRELLAAGVIAAERLDNIPLGLRLLTAASRAEGCAPDQGDALVASSSSAAQRAATILHRRAINRGVQDGSWKLSVKLLELMFARSLKPSPSVWRNVVTCCAKAEKSRKATALLLDWAQLSEEGRVEKPPLRVFNSVMNACEICGEEDLTVAVLETLKKTHDTDGNLITFNIALKRLAKLGNEPGCEGIIIGMLQSDVEPSVVSYTTAIAACVAEPKQSAVAVEWLKRMKSRRVQPNTVTFNTALASCLDGTLESTIRASQIASEMLQDIERQIDEGIVEQNEYTDIRPNLYTKALARQLMKQLKAKWEDGEIDKKLAKTTWRLPFLQLVEFERSEIGDSANRQKEFVTTMNQIEEEDQVTEDQVTATETDEEDLEYSVAVNTHRTAIV